MSLHFLNPHNSTDMVAMHTSGLITIQCRIVKMFMQ